MIASKIPRAVSRCIQAASKKKDKENTWSLINIEGKSHTVPSRERERERERKRERVGIDRDEHLLRQVSGRIYAHFVVEDGPL